MINFFSSLFKSTSQPNVFFFDEMKSKLNEMQKRLQYCQDNCQIQQEFVQQLIHRGLDGISNLSTYMNDIKLYVFDLNIKGCIHGYYVIWENNYYRVEIRNAHPNSYVQPTMIHYLLMNNLLRIWIKHLNDCLNCSKIIINLIFVKIQTPSLFHSTLPCDLRNKVIFIDTPGIKYGEQEQFQEPYKRIEDLIGNNYRINVWISNYTTFDSEKFIAYQILKIYEPIIQSLKISNSNLLLDITPEVEQSEILQDDLLESKEVISEPQQLPLLLFVLNKYDERKSEDLGIETTIQEICDKIGNKHFIYKISAIDSLQYQIMNFGNAQAVEKFLISYFADYGAKMNLTDLKQCKQYCLQKIKNNHNLIRNQDFQIFSNQLTSQIKQQINRGFYGDLLNDVIQSIVLVELVQSTVCIQLDESSLDQLNEFTEKFIYSLITTYKGIISTFERDAKTQITKQITISKEKLIKDDPSKIINSACKASVLIFKELEDKINEVNQEFKSIVIEKISTIFTSTQFTTYQSKVGEFQLQKQNSVVDCCLNLYEQFSDKQVLAIQKQSFEQYYNDIQRTLGVKMNSVQQPIGIASTSLSLITFFGSRFIMSVMFLSSPFFAIVGAGLLTINFDFIFGKTWYSLPVVQQSLDGALMTQLHFMCDNYLQIHKQTLEGLVNLLKSLNG